MSGEMVQEVWVISEPLILLAVKNPKDTNQLGRSVWLQEQCLHGSQKNMENSPTPMVSPLHYSKVEKDKQDILADRLQKS